MCLSVCCMCICVPCVCLVPRGQKVELDVCLDALGVELADSCELI